jgi:hypothetical protein
MYETIRNRRGGGVERKKELTCVEALDEGGGLPEEALAERARQAFGERIPPDADHPLLCPHLSPPPATTPTTTSSSWPILVGLLLVRPGAGENHEYAGQGDGVKGIGRAGEGGGGRGGGGGAPARYGVVGTEEYQKFLFCIIGCV